MTAVASNQETAESMLVYAQRIKREGEQELRELRELGSWVIISLSLAYEAIYQRGSIGSRPFDPRVDISGHTYIEETMKKMMLNATGIEHDVTFRMVEAAEQYNVFVPFFEIKNRRFSHAVCNQHAKREYVKAHLKTLSAFELVL